MKTHRDLHRYPHGCADTGIVLGVHSQDHDIARSEQCARLDDGEDGFEPAFTLFLELSTEGPLEFAGPVGDVVEAHDDAGRRQDVDDEGDGPLGDEEVLVRTAYVCLLRVEAADDEMRGFKRVLNSY